MPYETSRLVLCQNLLPITQTLVEVNYMTEYLPKFAKIPFSYLPDEKELHLLQEICSPKIDSKIRTAFKAVDRIFSVGNALLSN